MADNGRADNAAAAAVPPSPCRGICLMDPATRMCRGCLRTTGEIAAWFYADADEKRAILERLVARRQALGDWR